MHDHSAIFEQSRPTLFGLAYRILGSRSDAEDAVQDTFLKWQRVDPTSIENPAAWLTTICTRRCIDLLGSAQKARTEYVGVWLPEPIHTADVESHEEKLSLASSLQTAFLLVLERLTPKERAAYLLHEIFDVDYPEVAAALDMQEAACRKLVSRARANVEQAKVRHVTPRERQEELLSAFQSAIHGGNTSPLAALLADDIQLSADGGGKASAIGRVLHGKAEVLAFVEESLRTFWTHYTWTTASINGGLGIVLMHEGKPVVSASFAYDNRGAVTQIFIMRNPEKLAALASPPAN